MKDQFRLLGTYRLECRDPDGRVAWHAFLKNGITLAGLTDLLAAGFAGGTQRAWKFGLIASSGYSQVLSTDTMDGHEGWAEETNYAGDRPGWSPSTAGAVAAGSPAAFVFAADAAVKGVFLSSDATKAGTSGVLWSTALFASPRTVLAGQTLNVSYVLRAAGGAG